MKIISSELYVKDNKVYHEGNKPKPKDIGAAPETHTHNYASATTPGGSAEHAIKATEDSLGQRIDKYIKGLSVSGRTITYTRGDGTTGTITTQDNDTDTKVTNTLNTTAKAYITGTTNSATNTGTQVFDTNVYLDTTAGMLTATTFKGALQGNAATATSATSATKLATARTINGTSFDGTGNITTANWGTARNIQIGNSSKSVNGSSNMTWTLAEIGAAPDGHTHNYAPVVNGVQRWNSVIKCATWSRIMYLSGHSVVGHSGIINIQGTRGSVVFNATFIINASHASKAYITQINNTNYSNFQIRAVTNNGGDTYVEVYDNANGATNATTQTLNVSYTAISGVGAGTLTKYTAFTDGTTIPTGFAEVHKITTVNGSHYSGNAATATKLQTARTINGTSFDGTANITTANWGAARNIQIGNTAKSVNGSGNVSWSLSEIGAAPTSHNHTSLGGVTSIDFNAASTDGASIRTTISDAATYLDMYLRDDANQDKFRWRFKPHSSDTSQVVERSLMELYPTSANQKSARLLVDGEVVATNENGLRVVGGNYGFFIRNDGSNTYFMFTNSGDQYGNWNSLRPICINNSNGLVTFGNGLSGSLSGNASTATTLQTTRTINGTSFNGSANITTANWGTARNIQIGNTAKSVNGSDNVTWTLGEIGALPLSGGTVTGSTIFQQGTRVHSANGTSGTAGYVKIAQLKITGNYQNQPIYFLVSQRGRDLSTLEVYFSSINGPDPALSKFYKTGGVVAYLHKSATSVWDLYIKKSEGYDNIDILDFRKGSYMNGTTIKWTNVHADALPSGATAATSKEDRYIKGNNILLSVESDILNSSALTTSRKQLIAGSADKVYAGNTSANLILESSSTPQVRMNNNFYPIYHTANKPTASEIGAAAASHTHNYAASPSAGGSASTVYLPRVVGASVSANYLPGANKFEFKEFGDNCKDIPNASWYHIFTGQGSDANYNTQLALGMTTEAVYYRRRSEGTWRGWKQLAFTDSSISGNAATATKLQTARTINGTSFDGSGNITTANWGTARNLNGVSVNGSTNYTIPVENYCCDVNDNNTNLYHRILTTDIATANWVDKSLIIVMHSGYHTGGFGIAKITFRTNDISSTANSQAEIKWLVRNGFNENALVFNFINQAKNACMDVFYKSPGTYAGMTWYVLSEGGRGGKHSKQWTKYNTNASGTNAYTEANMKTLRTYTSTLVSATDAGHVSTANSASTLSTARTINGTAFNGSGNITTANWGAARNITIGNTTKSVNGSGNVSWSLAEIGAAPSSSTSLNTTDKTIVGAINEVFQSGNSVKQNLVDTLIAKGAEDISTSNSWDSLIDMIEGSNINLAPISFNVEQLPNAQYGFELLGSGYYESQNMNVHNSYAMCKLNIVCNRNYNVYLDCINHAENNYDYGIISQINTPLSFSYQTDPTGVLKSFKGLSSPGVQSVQLKSESGYYYIKYVKDSTASQGNDSLRFKVRFEKKPDGNPDVPGNPGGEETILFGSTIGGDNSSLTGGYTHLRQTSGSYFVYDDSGMDFMAHGTGRGGSTLETVISENRINLTNYSTLRIKGYFTTTTNDSGGAPLVGFDAIGNRDDAFAASIAITSSGQRYYDLDISGLTGNYHLKFNVTTSLVKPSTGEIIKHLYITELILYP